MLSVFIELFNFSFFSVTARAQTWITAIMNGLLRKRTEIILSLLGDIGKHFPDSDMTFKDADSRELLREVVNLVKEKGYTVNNIDCTVIAQKPKLKDYIEAMCKNIAGDCQIDISCVNVKATTEEGLGFTGDGSAIAAHAVCILV